MKTWKTTNGRQAARGAALALLAAVLVLAGCVNGTPTEPLPYCEAPDTATWTPAGFIVVDATPCLPLVTQR